MVEDLDAALAVDVKRRQLALQCCGRGRRLGWCRPPAPEPSTATGHIGPGARLDFGHGRHDVQRRLVPEEAAEVGLGHQLVPLAVVERVVAAREGGVLGKQIARLAAMALVLVRPWRA